MIASGSAGSSYNTSVAMEFFRFAGKPKTFAKGKRIFAENQRGIPFLLMPNRMYLLLDGEVGIFARDKPVGTVHPGQIFGEMASIDQGPRTGTALARTTCRVIALDDRQLRVALGRYPEFALDGAISVWAKPVQSPGTPSSGAIALAMAISDWAASLRLRGS